MSFNLLTDTNYACVIVYTVYESKKIPEIFWHFPKRLGIFYMPIFTRSYLRLFKYIPDFDERWVVALNMA